MKKQKTHFQTKEQDKALERDLNETDISDLPAKEVKISVIKMLTELRRRMDEESKNFNEEIENIRKYQIEVTELKNTIPELTNTLEGFNSRLDEAEERISELNDRAGNSPNQSSKKKKE